MAFFSPDDGDPVRMLAQEWNSGYQNFVCSLCRVRSNLLGPVKRALGTEEGAKLEHMWVQAQMHSPQIPSEEDICEVHNLSKEWRKGHRNFVLQICTRKPELLCLLMDFVGEQYSQDLLHRWLVEHLRQSTPPAAPMASPDMAAAGGSGDTACDA